MLCSIFIDVVLRFHVRHFQRPRANLQNEKHGNLRATICRRTSEQLTKKSFKKSQTVAAPGIYERCDGGVDKSPKLTI